MLLTLADPAISVHPFMYAQSATDLLILFTREAVRIAGLKPKTWGFKIGLWSKAR